MKIQLCLMLGLSIIPLFYIGPIGFAPYCIIFIPTLISFMIERSWVKYLASLINIFFILALLVESLHLLIYETVSTAGVYLAIFETDWREVKEFLEGQSITAPLLVLVSLGLTLLVGLKLKMGASKRAVLLLTLILTLVTLFQFDKLNSRSPLKLISFYLTYSAEKEDFKERFELRPLAPIVITDDSGLKSNTVVFILGESTTRNRMGIYGYPRDTTPRLNKHKSLIAFKNVVSPHTQTYKSLKKALTLLNHDNEKKLQDNIHIINLARASGYRTYWISNQKSLGKYENPHTIVAKAAHEVHWLKDYDEVSINALERVLLKTEEKKFIVIHLMGAHAHYKNRYPNLFSIFKSLPPVPNFVTNQSEGELYNEYDNAILYQDFVLSSLINTVRKNTAKYSLIYFPDHGEEVFQSARLLGHTEAITTANMYEIPLFFESSFPSLQKQASLSQSKVWSIEDFIHPLHSLLGVKTKYYEGERDFLSERFVRAE